MITRPAAKAQPLADRRLFALVQGPAYVACPVNYANNLNPAIDRAIEDEVCLKSLNQAHPQAR